MEVSETGAAREAESPAVPGGYSRRAATARRETGDYKRPKRQHAPQRLSRAEGRGRKGKRCYGHDYRQPGVYMITVSASLGAMPLSRLQAHDDGSVTTTFTKYGDRIARELRKLTETTCEGQTLFRAVPYVIMPDHLHFMLRVLHPLPLHLEAYLNAFLDRCNSAYANMRAYDRAKTSSSSPADEPELLFADGFHDLIGFTTPMERNMATYVTNNPLRLWQRHQTPDLHRVSALRDGTLTLIAQGNLDLLTYPERYALRVSRRLIGAELDEYLKPYYRSAARGAVIISPFVSPGEKQALEHIVATGGRVIIVEKRRIIDGDKPNLAHADALAEGRLLRVWWAPPASLVYESKAHFEHLNAGAAWLAKDARSYTPVPLPPPPAPR